MLQPCSMHAEKCRTREPVLMQQQQRRDTVLYPCVIPVLNLTRIPILYIKAKIQFLPIHVYRARVQYRYTGIIIPYCRALRPREGFQPAVPAAQFSGSCKACRPTHAGFTAAPAPVRPAVLCAASCGGAGAVEGLLQRHKRSRMEGEHQLGHGCDVSVCHPS